MKRLPRLSDLLTTANLCCGVLSAIMAARGQLTIACWLLFIAALFDVFDGLAARALGGGSEFGKQLDSLADMVSFGVAPGMIIYYTVGNGLTSLLLVNYFPRDPSLLADTWSHWTYWPAFLIALVIPVAAAWRLAKFNIDPRQSHGFLGLPSPANALFWAGLFLGLPDHTALAQSTIGMAVLNAVVLAAVVVVLAALMLTEIPLPSLKFTRTGWHGNEVMYILLALGAVLVMAFGFLAVPLLLILYLLSPLWGRFIPKTR